jgi:hypothetical protein
MQNALVVSKLRCKRRSFTQKTSIQAIHLLAEKFLKAIDTTTPGEAPFMNFGATSAVSGCTATFDMSLDVPDVSDEKSDFGAYDGFLPVLLPFGGIFQAMRRSNRRSMAFALSGRLMISIVPRPALSKAPLSLPQGLGLVWMSVPVRERKGDEARITAQALCCKSRNGLAGAAPMHLFLQGCLNCFLKLRCIATVSALLAALCCQG